MLLVNTSHTLILKRTNEIARIYFINIKSSSMDTLRSLFELTWISYIGRPA